jgi:WD40 repeat protein
MIIRCHHVCTGHRAAVYALSTQRDPGSFLSAGGDGWIVSWHWDNPENGHLVASIETQTFAVAQHVDSDTLIAGNMHGGMHFIRPHAPDQSRNIQHHQKGVFQILPSGNLVFSCGGDGVLTRWSMPECRSTDSLKLSAKALRAIARSPDGAELAVGSGDGNIYLLDAAGMIITRTLQEAHQHSVFALRYSPDGQLLISGGRDAMLRVWQREQYTLVSEQPAHWFTINSICWSPQDPLFATASRDKTIKIWDAQKLRLVKVIDTVRHGGHLNSVNALLWMPEGIVSASDDRTIRLWSICP